MRTFRDDRDRPWDVVAGRESWGAIVAIFVARGGSEPVRQAPFPASSYPEAEAKLARLEESDLRELLRGSEPKGS